MAASLQAAATFMTPAKAVVSDQLHLSSPPTICKAFGVESAGARVSCSLQSDLKEFAQKFTDAAKITGFALAISALVVLV
ncbi:hypothetical protein L1987_61135 [Smallanthus sonchifolius]|uniref:Uncharacterized protein n=1 Tax=Smallanthus sonchifolius TaxID=185202 RepID=A0ACB9DAW4_9ASTR|nr:hypothetical protein L1987_61135 [Smallanthus sonchifolius]